MDRYREKTSMVFTRLLYRFGRRRPAIAQLSEPLGSPGSQTSLGTEESTDTSPLSKSLGPPASQTSLSTSSRISPLNRTLTYSISVFELPDEIILSILSHIPQNTQATGHCAWFRDSYSMNERSCWDQREQVLRQLSMTCRAMRLRFVPWVWERLELSTLSHQKPYKTKIILKALHTDVFLATSIRYFHAVLSLGRG